MEAYHEDWEIITENMKLTGLISERKKKGLYFKNRIPLNEVATGVGKR